MPINGKPRANETTESDMNQLNLPIPEPLVIVCVDCERDDAPETIEQCEADGWLYVSMDADRDNEAACIWWDAVGQCPDCAAMDEEHGEGRSETQTERRP